MNEDQLSAAIDRLVRAIEKGITVRVTLPEDLEREVSNALRRLGPIDFSRRPEGLR
jgi:hypothetical protein